MQSDCPPFEKSTQRLMEEGQTVIGAGMITTKHYLYSVTYLILSNPDLHAKIRKELEDAMPAAEMELSVVQLEKLPYLSAVIKEGHRRVYGIQHRLLRIDSENPMEYNGFMITPGTPVGMSAKMKHDDPFILPNPHKFDPERWLKPGAEHLEHHLGNFGKGTRQCLGQNLANAEIYLALSTVFRRFGLALYETAWEDVEIVHDWFNPTPRKSSRGVRVLVK